MEDDALDGVSNAEALERIAFMVDHAADTQDGHLTDRALRLSEHLSARDSLGSKERVLLHYFRANAFENKLHEAGQAQSWSWEIPHPESVILELREAARPEAFADVGAIRQCQILTNLGNKLSSVGRPIEALAHWDRAITLEPRFAMALGNRGQGLGSYAHALYDVGHFGLLLLSAHGS